MVVIALMAILFALGAESFAAWRQNSQVRNAAEAFQNGLNLARTEAVSRNTRVRFQIMTTLDNSCALSDTGTNWIVSINDASGSCDSEPTNSSADPGNPLIVQLRPAADGSRNAAINANGINVITFDALGRASSAATIDFSNPSAFSTPDEAKCVLDGGKVRCLRVTVTTGGQIRMCDPARRTDNNDPQAC